jgi:hypothetical protein
MAYRFEKNNQDTDIVISGFENGIARSPLSGIANMQSVNIGTENKEVLNSYGRYQQTVTTLSTTGSLTYSDTSHVALQTTNSNNKYKGMWITVSGSSHPGELANGNYYVLQTTGTGFVLATTYNGSGITGYTSGLTASFTLIRTMSKPISSATESYTYDNVLYYRYYVLDTQGLVWVYDSINELSYNTQGSDNVSWFLPDYSISSWAGTTPSSISVYNGWLHMFSGDKIWVKPTVNLASTASTTTNWTGFSAGELQGKASNTNPHYSYSTHSGRLLYTDGNYIGSVFASTSLLNGAPNVQSYAQYTGSGTTGTITQLFSGSTPTSGVSTPRIPVYFFTALTTGAQTPAAITSGTVYYIEYSKAGDTFQVFAALTGGAALNIQTGAVGTQYFNTYYPVSAGGNSTIVFTPIALILPQFEIATSIAEAGAIVVLGTKSNVLYPWDQLDITPFDLIPLPENNTSYLLTVNNMIYAFVGNKGNIYVTNGSTASLVLSVPDYCAGIAGSAQSYIEPYFEWGGAMYARGKVYFSIQDQTASDTNFAAKAGNCGGIWSFVPTQNFYYGQDTGLSLRMENISSYATLNGASSVLLVSQNQKARGVQYWSGWYDGLSSVKYGIDASDFNPNPSTPAVIETDLIPTGTLLNKTTFRQIEYKLSTPLVSGESVSLSYRLNSTGAYTSCGTIISEGSSTDLSGYLPVNFEKGQWLQLKITLTPVAATVTNSFVRLTEIRVR